MPGAGRQFRMAPPLTARGGGGIAPSPQWRDFRVRLPRPFAHDGYSRTQYAPARSAGALRAGPGQAKDAWVIAAASTLVNRANMSPLPPSMIRLSLLPPPLAVGSPCTIWRLAKVTLSGSRR